MYGAFAIGIEKKMTNCHFAAESNMWKNLLHGPRGIHCFA